MITPKLLTFLTDEKAPVKASVWSQGPDGSLWVVPLEGESRKLVRVRRLARRYVVDHRELPETAS